MAVDFESESKKYVWIWKMAFKKIQRSWKN